MTAKKVDLTIEQGKTFARTVRWETSPRVWKAISNVAKSGPVSITATGHGMPDGWRAAVVNVLGMLDINAKHNPPWDIDLLPATVSDVNTVLFNEVSSADFDAYVSGGYLVYWTPHDLTGYTARMKIKDKIGGTVLETVTCTVDEIGKTIALVITAADTTAFTWLKGVYDLEMVSPGGVVTAILSGSVNIISEVTT